MYGAVEINEAARVALGPGRHLEVPYAIARVLAAHVELVHVLQELGQEAMVVMELCVSSQTCAHAHAHTAHTHTAHAHTRTRGHVIVPGTGF